MPPVASLVVQDLIRASRDEHPTFDDRRHPDRLLTRSLSRYQRRLVSRIIRANPTILLTQLDQALPLPDFDAGITLPDHKYVAAVEVETLQQESGLRQPRFQVEVIPWQARFRWHLAAFVRNSVLHLTGSEREWVGFISLRIFYMPEVEELTAITSVLVLPNGAEPCLVAFLASVMAQRGAATKDLERPDARGFRADWREVEEEFLDEMGLHQQAQVSVIHEAF